MLKDSQQRSQATDPSQSFIVQAPAGSGKTEILSQRFLRLLSTVTAPEQIVALTFTRKAANEMRERIIIALKQASQDMKASSAHQQQTLDFAKQALERSQHLKWQLLEQPSRLKVMTIDALCQSISQAMPLQEKQIPFAGITEKAQQHFKSAASNCLRFAMAHEVYQGAVQTLLLHLDNRHDLLIELFSSLLANRDQWLSPLYEGRHQDKASYEKALMLIETHELRRFQQSLPPVLAGELVKLARQLVDIEADPHSSRYLLRDWESFSQTSAETAKALSALILTGENKCRKAFDHHVGLKKDKCTADEFKQLKSDSQVLLSELADHPDFIEALLRVKDLPSPNYDPQQWQTLNALFNLLPLSVGHLQLVFSEHNEVDFTAISQQALMALGDEEHPTDLALYLDHSIHHLLVDEFQDTSMTQFQLLSQLVQEWQPDEGRTLFVVGDPMQSIYRFRQAEVGLFLRAQQQGIGPVKLKPLELQCNFRSTANIVHWINQQFHSIFPAQFDIESGAVSFHPSVHVLEEKQDSGVHAWQFADRQQEALALVLLIKQRMTQYPEEDIAILVRSRSQLAPIVGLLREHQIIYQGVEIDLLAKLPHIRDIWSLTKALLTPANRLAWLALLRSPYVGVSLSDMHRLACYSRKTSLYQILSDNNTLEALSPEGQQRIRYFYMIMHKAICNRYQLPLSDWINQTHKQLKGDRFLTAAQQNDLEQFWLLIDRFETDGQIADQVQFESELAKLYSQQVTPSKLQIMTIHKSKGLEFDCVILPSLSSPPKAPDKPLLRWLKLPTGDHQQDLLLLSPIKAMHQEKCALYDYLGKLDEQKSSYELQRLFYVAATRAKKTLYLLDNKSKAPKNSFRSLLKQQLFIEHEDENQSEEQPLQLPKLFKIPLSDYEVHINESPSIINQVPSVFSEDKARIAGVLTHEVLQWIGNNHPDSFQEIPWHYVNYALDILCLDSATHANILEQLTGWLKNLYACPIGQWIIQKHSDEHNEYELLIEKEGLINTKIIDRCFVDQGVLWIIDFKTGGDGDLAEKAHHKQVNEYASILSSHYQQAIHCGVYYLNNNHWTHWAFIK